MAVESGSQIEVEGRGNGEQIGSLADRSRSVFGGALTFAAALVAIIVASSSLIACAKTPAQKVEADLATIRRESDAKTLLERGKGFAAVGDFTRAEEYIASAIDAGADARDALPLLMDVCVRTGRYRSAIQHGENHLRKHPHDVETRVMVGALYTAINEGKQARVQLEQVVGKIDPNDPAAFLTQDAGASPSNANATKPSPNGDAVGPRLRAQAHYLLGIVSRDADNDIVSADRHFREYLRIEPNGSHAEEAKAALLKRVEPAAPAAASSSSSPSPQPVEPPRSKSP